MRSFLRSVILRKPSESISPMSPVASQPPSMIAEADYLLVESTYGNRVHAEDDDGSQLAGVIAETALRGGRQEVSF